MDAFVNTLADVAARDVSESSVVINDAYKSDLTLPAFKDDYTLQEVAAYEKRIGKIIEAGYSLAVHTDYRHVPTEQQVAMGVGDAIYTTKEKEIMAMWDPVVAAGRFDAATMRAPLPAGYKQEKHNSDLEALRMALNSPALVHENLHWFKNNMSSFIELISAYKKKAVIASGRKGGKLSHRLFAEYTTVTALVGLTASRVQQIAVEVNELMQVHAGVQKVLSLRKQVLKANEQGAPIDPRSLPENKAREIAGLPSITSNITFGTGNTKRKRLATSAALSFGAGGEDVDMRAPDDDSSIPRFESSPAVRAIERKVLDCEVGMRNLASNEEVGKAYAEVMAKAKSNVDLADELRYVLWRESRMPSVKTPAQGTSLAYSKIQEMVVRVFNTWVTGCGATPRAARDAWEGEPLWDIMYANVCSSPVVLGTTLIRDEDVYAAVLKDPVTRLYPLKGDFEYVELRKAWKEVLKRIFRDGMPEPTAAQLTAARAGGSVV